jgi:hypothetical protein
LARILGVVEDPVSSRRIGLGDRAVVFWLAHE